MIAAYVGLILLLIAVVTLLVIPFISWVAGSIMALLSPGVIIGLLAIVILYWVYRLFKSKIPNTWFG